MSVAQIVAVVIFIACMSTFFITGDFEPKVSRIMERYNLDRHANMMK